MREKVKIVNFAIAKLLKMTLVDERDHQDCALGIAKLLNIFLVDESESQNCELCYSKNIKNDFGG